MYHIDRCRLCRGRATMGQKATLRLRSETLICILGTIPASAIQSETSLAPTSSASTNRLK